MRLSIVPHRNGPTVPLVVLNSNIATGSVETLVRASFTFTPPPDYVAKRTVAVDGAVAIISNVF